jgi:hypothetical protein
MVGRLPHGTCFKVLYCGEKEAASCFWKGYGYGGLTQLMLRSSFERPRKSALSVGVVDVFIGHHWFSHLVIHSFQIVILFHLTRFDSTVCSLSSYSDSLSCSLGTNRSFPPQFLHSPSSILSLEHAMICHMITTWSNPWQLETSAPTRYLRALLVQKWFQGLPCRLR